MHSMGTTMTRAQPPRPRDSFAYRRGVKARSLDDDEVTLLHQASLEILERSGMRFRSTTAVELFRRAGAIVSDGNLVCIPAHLVERAVQTAPKNIMIFDRNGRPAMALGGHRSYYGPGSDAAHVYDIDTGERRKAVMQDVVAGARLANALPNIDYTMSQFMPSDVRVERYERLQMASMLQECSKPIVFVGLEKMSTVYAVEMACAVAGGLEQLVRYPFIINYVNSTSPYVHNEESVERLLYAAGRNLPSIYTPGRARGSQVPMTEAGAIALVNAGQLAGLVLSQLKREGSPFIWASPNAGGMDLRTMVSLYGTPDAGPAAWDLAHHYQIPIFGFAGISDAKVFDAQAAAEATLTLFEAALFGANLIHDIGLLDCGMTGSLELLAFCDEVIGWLRQYLRPLEISEETLALDTILQAVPDGHFLDSEHTLRHVRDTWMPALFDRRPYHRWAAAGSPTTQELAVCRVKEIVKDCRAAPLEASATRALATIVDAD
jgi:trimethylamine---corrinoid protein Co-methyltransferase